MKFREDRTPEPPASGEIHGEKARQGRDTDSPEGLDPDSDASDCSTLEVGLSLVGRSTEQLEDIHVLTPILGRIHI